MTAQTTLALARDCDNIIGVKEASGNFTQIEEIIKNKPERFEVISGDARNYISSHDTLVPWVSFL